MFAEELPQFRCGIFSPLLRFLNDLGNAKPRKNLEMQGRAVEEGSVRTEKGNDQDRAVTNLSLSLLLGAGGG